MELYLIRHGEANPGAIDPSRSLTEKGESDASVVGRYLAGLGLTVAHLFSSDKSRAVQTASIVAGEIGFDRDRILSSGQLHPQSAPHEVGGLISTEEEGGNVVVVGHMPSLARYASYLISSDPNAYASLAFSTCAVACLKGSGPKEPGNYSLKFLVSPDLFIG